MAFDEGIDITSSVLVVMTSWYIGSFSDPGLMPSGVEIQTPEIEYTQGGYVVSGSSTTYISQIVGKTLRNGVWTPIVGGQILTATPPTIAAVWGAWVDETESSWTDDIEGWK